jgi:hypothetical protein
MNHVHCDVTGTSVRDRETEKPPHSGFQLSTRGLALCVIIVSIWYMETHLVLLTATTGAKHRPDLWLGSSSDAL